MKTKLFTLLFALVTSVGIMCAEKVQIGDLYYTLNPSYKLAHVTFEKDMSQDNYAKLSGEVIIPASVKYKGKKYSVSDIEMGAFLQCQHITSVVIPKSIQKIDPYAFGLNAHLTSFQVDKKNRIYSSVDGVLFDKSKTTLVRYPGGRQGDYTIPQGVTRIGQRAFAFCNSLTSIIIPGNVSKIGNYAFGSCQNLVWVLLSDGVQTIGKDAFNNCSQLQMVLIPSTVTSIGETAFQKCPKIFVYNASSVSIPELSSLMVISGSQEQSEQKASFYLGRIYNEGSGVSQDYAQALKWYEKAASKGWWPAQKALGVLYYNGRGTAKDYTQAFSWFKKAADKGDKDASFFVGYMYYAGEGVARDYQQAVSWFKKAGEKGQLDAQCFLAHLYAYGEEIDLDLDQSEYWFDKAIEQVEKDSRYPNKKYYTLAGLTEDHDHLMYCCAKMAEQGNKEAQYELGDRYFSGKDVEKDEKKAIYWFEKAGEKGHFYALLRLCTYYQERNDEAKIFYWYRKLAEQGEVLSQKRVGEMYAYGVGVARDQAQAFYWYKKAAEQGDADSQFYIAWRYFSGEGVSRDCKQAYRWALKSVEQGKGEAAGLIGLMYDCGCCGLERDAAKAQYWDNKEKELKSKK